MAAGRNRSTWQKGKKPPFNKPKGCKNKINRLKESIGLENWEGLKSFVEQEGATKLIKEMKKLKGRSYVQAMHAMAEYIKPKLRRVDGNLNANLSFKDKDIKFE